MFSNRNYSWKQSETRRNRRKKKKKTTCKNRKTLFHSLCACGPRSSTLSNRSLQDVAGFFGVFLKLKITDFTAASLKTKQCFFKCFFKPSKWGRKWKLQKKSVFYLRFPRTCSLILIIKHIVFHHFIGTFYPCTISTSDVLQQTFLLIRYRCLFAAVVWVFLHFCQTSRETPWANFKQRHVCTAWMKCQPSAEFAENGWLIFAWVSLSDRTGERLVALTCTLSSVTSISAV